MTDSEKAFATRMREKRQAREREKLHTSGAIDAAWQHTYISIVSQFGHPTEERDHLLVWRRDSATVALDMGLVHYAMRRPSQRLAIQEMVRRHAELVAAPATNISFVVSCAKDQFNAIVPLETWSHSHNLPQVRVLQSSSDKSTFLFVRSNGALDWFGTPEKKRPVMEIVIL